MIELLCLITNEKNDKKVKNIEEKYQLPFNITSFGNGTASSSVLNYFGLEKIKKYIYFSLINNENKKTILKEIKKELKLNTPGNGIAFTIPLSSSSYAASTKEIAVGTKKKEEKKKEEKKNNNKNTNKNNNKNNNKTDSTTESTTEATTAAPADTTTAPAA